MNPYSASFLARMRGNDTESAYARAFAGRIIGGIKDCGKDVSTGDPDVPYVQVKSSIEELLHFLARSLRRKQFIPICVGEPGAKDEMIRHLRQFGAWIGTDIPGREKFLNAVAQVRSMCAA